MNREILFMGKSTCDESWQYGSLFIEKNTNITDYKTKPLNYYILPLDADYEEGNIDCYEVDPETVSEYSNKTDKEGNKIFEGHILEYDGGGKFVVCFLDAEMYCPVDEKDLLTNAFVGLPYDEDGEFDEYTRCPLGPTESIAKIVGHILDEEVEE